MTSLDLANGSKRDGGLDRAVDDLDVLDQDQGSRLITPDDDEWPLLSFTAFGGL